MGVLDGEFSRIIESQLLGPDESTFEFVAEAAECRALARGWISWRSNPFRPRFGQSVSLKPEAATWIFILLPM